MGTEGENTTSSPWSVTVRPLPEGAFSRRGGKGRDGGGLRRRTKEWTWDGERGWQRACRKAGKQYWSRFGWRTDFQEEDDQHILGWGQRREEPRRIQAGAGETNI